MGALNIHNEELIYAVFDKVTIKNEISPCLLKRKSGCSGYETKKMAHRYNLRHTLQTQKQL